ncbi:MAG TPA: class I SAM-dependent methyltransferase [Firmicutes bacterium]|nr:class I SAM-dependent methyltransferase [Bacillota bacterium]
MVEHYFTREPGARHREKLITARLRGREYRFWTDSSVFSKDRVDRGTRLLIEGVSLREDAWVLDLGCGYGPIGIAVAALVPRGRVYLVDVNERAVSLARRNVELNGVGNAIVLQGEGYEPVAGMMFDAILTNPPIRAGRKVIVGLIAEARTHLRESGSFWLVARTRQGVLSLAAEMERIFGNAEECEKGGGFRVIRSQNLRPSIGLRET